MERCFTIIGEALYVLEKQDSTWATRISSLQDFVRFRMYWYMDIIKWTMKLYERQSPTICPFYTEQLVISGMNLILPDGNHLPLAPK